ncbi:MAG TPA: quinoprotein dehydrogenase-associated putative ABC transporter substrate-binding protein [Rhodanobacteraceae bacterium]|jgi:quinoprotein dehydrogenase-associated probable ABC transporter substrate-binding protein|nr:quinoprotein dehydrogenase-associated putative ABC transporter substrate-binding protein [Rhodanobacteraceae bacterium]
MKTWIPLLLALILPAFAFARTHTQYPGAAPAPANQPLRVCADPNDLPFSNRAGQGFENKLAEMLAQSLGKTVVYTWAFQQKQFLRDTLDAGKCDVVMALPTADKDALTTQPYYRSAYAFVYRADAPFHLTSLQDPRLRSLRIGVHALGDDWVDLPGGATLAHKGIVTNVRVYKMFSDFSKPNPASDLMEAVAKGDIDVAIAWGPLAGYFATREPVELKVVPLTDAHTVLPFQFSISMAVRHGDTKLRDKLNAFLATHRDSIRDLLTNYGVPQLKMAGREAPKPEDRLTRSGSPD